MKELHIRPHASKNEAIKVATRKVEISFHRFSNYQIKLGAFLYHIIFTMVKLGDHEAALKMQ
jgi:hypothetical protein